MDVQERQISQKNIRHYLPISSFTDLLGGEESQSARLGMACMYACVARKVRRDFSGLIGE